MPLAAVLWRNGIGFGGAIAFIFGDLIIIPILNIYRKYYSARVAAYLLAVSYVTMVAAGLAVGPRCSSRSGWVPAAATSRRSHERRVGSDDVTATSSCSP